MQNNKTIREKLVEEFYDFNVSADITIESLVDVVMDVVKDLQGETYVNEFHKCPICTDCPDGCPLEKDSLIEEIKKTFINEKLPMSVHTDDAINAMQNYQRYVETNKSENKYAKE